MKGTIPMIMRMCAVVALALAVSACGGQSPFEIDLMPAPEVYDEDGFNPLADASPMEELPYDGVLFATDRRPAKEGDQERFYVNHRGDYLSLGIARIEMGEETMTWEEARRISLLKNRSAKYPLTVSDVENYGVLDRSVSPFTPIEMLGENLHAAAARYAGQINAQLAKSQRKHIYIYVHGYRVVFENPLLVATELWHFLGYDGVFIAYSWSSTPSKWAYLKDTEVAAGFARNLRLFLEYLAEETDAEQIHVLGYSAGTRLVARAFEQLALIHQDRSPAEIRTKLRLGQLILVGSDIERRVFGQYVADGLLNVPNHLVIYMSETDKALAFSQRLTRRERLGQMFTETSEELEEFLEENSDRISIVNVSGAEGSTIGNGHGYFRSSPWASSDILMSMMYNLGPAERGLVRDEDTGVWIFPPDYITRLRATLARVNLLLATDP